MGEAVDDFYESNELTQSYAGVSEGSFEARHIGPNPSEIQTMLKKVGVSDLAEFLEQTVPQSIRREEAVELTYFSSPRTEAEVVARAAALASKNVRNRSLIGMGYYGTTVPGVILRNIFENPGWYTQYTPYQPEISQGRLEALLNYQTLVCELTGFPIANASLLDEGTAAAEAMTLAYNQASKKGVEKNLFFVASDCHPQTIDVVETRAEALGLAVKTGAWESFSPTENCFGALVQYPTTYGSVCSYKEFAEKCHAVGAVLTVAADPLALTLLTPPASFGADIAVGSMQRFGVPIGFGGPHAAYMATRDEYKRSMPGRLVGVSRDRDGKPALRLALQTREQHIRREKATSNICTAQVLLAVMAGMYAVYHGPSGLRRIAKRIHSLTARLAAQLKDAGVVVENSSFFDTITFSVTDEEAVRARAEEGGVNFAYRGDGKISLSLDETVTEQEVDQIAQLVVGKPVAVAKVPKIGLPGQLLRKDDFLKQPVFHQYQTETEFLRYVKRLESKDLSLCQSMIPLGSCTMKLNATAEMVPVTMPGFSDLHPFAPVEQTEGYRELMKELAVTLAEITGFAGVSLQPNAGSQGEYAGLMAIRGYHKSRGDLGRNVCIIPRSAHGTNPASAVMAGFRVVVVECDSEGNIDKKDLKEKIEANRESLAALMITYPSTHGVFEDGIQEVCKLVHAAGGQVYLDGANLNALVGLARPNDFGPDVCHINLHKTFCIPHGGGGPGMGPIAGREHLLPFFPGHAVVEPGNGRTSGAISAAPWGSASILPISWAYMALMGQTGLRAATEVAVLSANYIAARLEPEYTVLYKGKNGRVAHECIIDLRKFKESAGIEAADVAKRLMDYGFHAPTMSWPVAGTLMIEPTESESLYELDRFCDAMLSIREEIRAIEEGKISKDENPLKLAPHTAQMVTAETWDRPYTREQAAYPAPWTKEWKFWPAVGRIEDSYGDRNLVCTCPDIDSFV